MRLRGVENFDDGHTVSRYEGTACEGCPAREKCTKGERRTVAIDSRQCFREAMREKLRSDRGRETYMKRQGIAEPLRGDDQKNRGWRQHHLRGLSKASLEFVLIRIEQVDVVSPFHVIHRKGRACKKLIQKPQPPGVLTGRFG